MKDTIATQTANMKLLMLDNQCLEDRYTQLAGKTLMLVPLQLTFAPSLSLPKPLMTLLISESLSYWMNTIPNISLWSQIYQTSIPAAEQPRMEQWTSVRMQLPRVVATVTSNNWDDVKIQNAAPPAVSTLSVTDPFATSIGVAKRTTTT